MGNMNSESSIKEEELPIQIYEIVHTKYPECSDKITGMILESDSEELRTLLLDDREELSKRIKMAATVLQNDNKLQQENHAKKNHIPDSCDDIDAIGNKVYGIVHQHYPLFAKNITGMLLEMDINHLRTLLNDKDGLIECIHQAAHVYMESQMSDENKKISTSDLSPPNNPPKTDIISTQKAKTEQEDIKQTLGEQIYLKIAPVHPEKTAKLTGMFLEMDTESLQKTLDNHELFETKLTEALDVLHSSTAKETDSINGVLHKLDENEKLIEINVSNNIDTSSPTSNKEEAENEKQDLAEQLYLKVVAKHPLVASKVTGMFLEMDLHSLRELNENSEFFNKKLNESIQVLSEYLFYE